MINHIIILLCLFRVFLYAIGDVYSSNTNQHAILFKYSYWLAKNRLKKEGLFEQFLELKNSVKNSLQKKDYKLLVVNNAKEYFTWENMAGMCGVCTFFWVSLLGFLVFNLNIEGLLYFSIAQIANKIIVKWI